MLDPNWPKKLAGTLYLPEQVELTGDTVILARRVIFEGRRPVIKGNYNVAFLPAEMDGAMGTTLEVAMKEQGVKAERAGHISAHAPKRYVPRLLEKDWSLTIDTSGIGRKEWLEEQEKAKRVSFRKTA